MDDSDRAEGMLNSQDISDDLDDSEWVGAECASGSPHQIEQVPLIPGDWLLQSDASENFVAVFEYRYGGEHPNFFIGPLEDAMKAANVGATGERRPLLVYLHDDAAVAANVFPKEVLCCSEITQLINAQFVIWAWDVTQSSNRRKLVEWANHLIGDDAKRILQITPTADYPLLLAMTKDKSRPVLLEVIRGAEHHTEVFTKLLDSLHSFQEQVQVEFQEENDRRERDDFRRQQEAAYNEAIEMDRAKEVERTKLEEEAKAVEHQAKMAEEDRLRTMEQLKSLLPDEPEEGSGRPLVTIRFRLPQGQPVTRRFYMNDRLSLLLNYAASTGYEADRFRLLTSHPKRDLCAENADKTLQELGLSSREQITVEER